MPTLAELKQAREKAGADLIQMRDKINAEGYQATSSDEEAWGKVNAAYDAAQKAEEEAVAAENKRLERNARIEQIQAESERLEQAHRGFFRPDSRNADPRSRGGSAAPSLTDYTQAIRTWASARMDDYNPTEEDLHRCRALRINPNAEGVNLFVNQSAYERQFLAMQAAYRDAPPHLAHQRALEVSATMNTQSPEDGGIVTTPPTLLRDLELNMLAFGGILQAVTVLTTGTRERITLPTANDTTNKGRRIGEGKSLGTKVNPKIGQITWDAYKYTSDKVVVTYEMLSDPWFNLVAFITEICGERLGRILNEELTTGTGNSMPRGLVPAATVGKTTASSTAITTDEVIDLEHSLDPAYRQGRTVGFMCHDSIVAYLRKLKDLEGRPFYTLGQETGTRDRLNGKPIYINLDMDSTVAASKKTLLYGDFSKYRVRRVSGIRLVRDSSTLRMTEDSDQFAMLIYADGNLVDAGTPPVVALQQKA